MPIHSNNWLLFNIEVTNLIIDILSYGLPIIWKKSRERGSVKGKVDLQLGYGFGQRPYIRETIHSALNL